MDSYARFLDLLLASPVRLTAVPAEEAYERHVADALAGAAAVDAEPGPLIDVGSGTGVPGMVLAIADPARAVTLLEANGRKAAALQGIAGELGLDGVTVVASRAELAARLPDHRDAYAVAVCRALARTPIAVELCLPFVRPGGLLLMWVGADDGVALDGITATLGGVVEGVTAYGSAPPRRLLAIRKRTATPERFPRRDGMAAKRPLVS